MKKIKDKYLGINCIVVRNPLKDKDGDKCVHVLDLNTGNSDDILQSDINWMTVGFPMHEAARKYFRKLT